MRAHLRPVGQCEGQWTDCCCFELMRIKYSNVWPYNY